MHGRHALLLKVLAVSAVIWVLAGCEKPRIKSYESVEAATLTNPPRDFKKAPLDTYSWGGIAMATGGRDSRTTYGAMSPGTEDGVDEVYLQGGHKTPATVDSTAQTYLIPDPRFQNKTEQFLGSTYIDNDAPADPKDGAHVIDQGGVLDANPLRAETVQPKHVKG